MEKEEEQNIFVQDCRVAYSQVGQDGCLKPVTALNLCQDVASRHAFSLGLSALHMAALNKIWVVHRYHFDFYRFPFWDEPFSIRSWRAPLRRLYEMRRFVFLDRDEKPLMESTCAWVLVDRTTGKPARLDRFLPARFCESDGKIPFFPEEIPLPESDTPPLCFQVLQDDVDYNRHANNAAYLKWALEALCPEDLFPCRIRNLDMQYHHDIGLHQHLELYSERRDTPGTPLIQCMRQKDGSLLTRLRMGFSV